MRRFARAGYMLSFQMFTCKRGGGGGGGGATRSTRARIKTFRAVDVTASTLSFGNPKDTKASRYKYQTIGSTDVRGQPQPALLLPALRTRSGGASRISNTSRDPLRSRVLGYPEWLYGVGGFVRRRLGSTRYAMSAA